MKKLLLFSILLFGVKISFCQITPNSRPTQHVYQSTYESPDWGLILQVLEKKNAAYEKNSEYLDALLNFIFETKTKTNDERLHRELNAQYSKLIKLADTDLAIANNSLRKIELSIKKSIENFVVRENKKNNPETFYSKAFNAYESRDYNSAILNFSKVIELVPEYEPAYTMRAQCYSDLGLYSKSLSDINKSLELKPDNIYPLFIRGWCFNYLENFTKAIRDFNKIIDVQPEKDYGYFGRGYAKANLSDYYGANKDYLKTIELNPNHSMAYNNLGWNHFEKGEFNKALEYVNKALELDTKNYTAWDSRAEIHFNLNDYNQCINDCDIALSINPKIANCYFLKGRAFYRIGKKEEACKEWSSAGENGKFEAYEYISKYCQ